MDKYLLIGVVIAVSLLLVTFGHMGYMKATSYECVTEHPPTHLVGGESEQIITTKCEGGILAKFPFEVQG